MRQVTIGLTPKEFHFVREATVKTDGRVLFREKDRIVDPTSVVEFETTIDDLDAIVAAYMKLRSE